MCTYTISVYNVLYICMYSIYYMCIHIIPYDPYVYISDIVNHT